MSFADILQIISLAAMCVALFAWLMIRRDVYDALQERVDREG